MIRPPILIIERLIIFMRIALILGALILAVREYRISVATHTSERRAYGPDLAVVERKICDGPPIDRKRKAATKMALGYERILCTDGKSGRIIMLNPKTYAGALEPNNP